MADLEQSDADTAARLKSQREEEDGPPSARTFTFVTAHDDSRARSHAMRESWRKRKLQKHQQQRQNQTRVASSGRQDYRRLVPKPPPAVKEHEPKTPEEVAQVPDAATFLNTGVDDLLSLAWTPMDWSADESLVPLSHTDSPAHTDDTHGDQQPLGIASQALTGMNHALATVSLDPFDTFPVNLTARHHELLHHCKTSLIRGR
jgi:hypothetical protein